MLLCASSRQVAPAAAGRLARAACAPVHVARPVLSVGARRVSMMAAAAAPPVREDGVRRVLVPVANGTEEMEAVIIIDVLRRAGAKVTVASVEPSETVVCSRGVKLVADVLIGAAAGKCYDLIACPGGMPGAERLRDTPALEQLVAAQAASGRLYAAICATPYVFLQAKGLLGGKPATAHPAFSDGLTDQTKVLDRVVVAANLTTSRGPGTAFEFALSLVQQMYGEEKAQQVAGPMVMYPHHV